MNCPNRGLDSNNIDYPIFLLAPVGVVTLYLLVSQTTVAAMPKINPSTDNPSPDQVSLDFVRRNLGRLFFLPDMRTLGIFNTYDAAYRAE